MRPLLRPGTHVLRRGDGHLQVGLDPAGAVLLPDRPEVRAVLDSLDGRGQPPDAPVLALLTAEHLVVDERAVLPLLRRSRPGASAAGALARHRGDDAGRAATGRRRARIQARRFGPAPVDPALDLVDHVARLAAAMGLGGGGGRSGAGAAPGDAGPGSGLVGLLAGVGEPDRELADPWTQAGTPYVVVRLTEGRAVVGPFVVPGETACLRCVDAHHTDADPAWPLLVHQYARATCAPRADGLPEPVDPSLVLLAAAWATRDLASHAEGLRPSTWSTTVTLDAALTSVESRCWLRHPECGCSWR